MIAIFETFSNLMSAATFAEAGEFHTASQMMPESVKGKKEFDWIEAVSPRTS